MLPPSLVSPSSVSSSSGIPIDSPGELDRDAVLELPPLRLERLLSKWGGIGTSMLFSSKSSDMSVFPSPDLLPTLAIRPPLVVRVSLLDAL